MENPVQSVAALNPQKVGTAVCEFLRVSCDMETLSEELLDSTLSLLCIAEYDNVEDIRHIGELLVSVRCLLEAIASGKEVAA